MSTKGKTGAAQASAKSWRDELPVHSAAELFPLLAETNPEALETLAQDIKANGLRTPIAIQVDADRNPTLLDGRNRLDALWLLGKKIPLYGKNGMVKWIPKDVDPVAFIVSCNIHRRHLGAAQKDELAAKLLKAKPEASNLAIAKLVKRSDKTVAKVRRELEARSEIPNIETRTDTKGRQQPARRLSHRCWQCTARAGVLAGEVRQHGYPAYEDADVWLHDSCVATFEAQEAERAAAAEPDVGPHTGGVTNGKRGIALTGVAAATHDERGVDLYETPEPAIRALLRVEYFTGTIWEPACGPGAIVNVLRATGHHVVATNIESYGCPNSLGGVDFLAQTTAPKDAGTIVTNPPFMKADDFVRHALKLVPRVAMLLRLAFLEGQGRSDILDSGHLARVYVFRNRFPMMHRAGWAGPQASSALAFAWFCWDRNHSGPTELARISWQADAAEPAPLAAVEQGDDFDIPPWLQRTAPMKGTGREGATGPSPKMKENKQ